MKRILALILSAILLVTTVISMDVLFVQASDSGSCGTNATYVYDSDSYTLTISGTGAISSYNRTTSKAPWSDYRSEITTLVIESGITAISQYDFGSLTSLTSVTLPSTLTSIASSTISNLGAFAGCTSLTTITLPSSLTTIGNYAFSGCTSLKSITFPDALTSLGNYAFTECSNLATATYGTGLTSTGTYAFYNAGVKTLNLSSTITAVDNYSFYGCSFTTIELPDTVTSIGTRAFANCSFLTTVTVNNADTTFSGDPFNGSSQTVTFYGHSSSTTQTYVESYTGNSNADYVFVSLDECEHTQTYTEITLEPTCTETGITTVICSDCGQIVSQTQTSALGHTYVLEETVDNTAVDGHTYETYVCSVCGDDYVDTVHNEWVEGYYTYTNTATCTTAGIETYTCNVDGCTSVKRSIVASGNHSVDSYTVTQEPTCTEEGIEEGVCSVCGETVEQSISALGHDTEYIETLDNTEEDGHTYDIYECTRCGEQVIEMTHVDWVDGYYTSTVITEAKCVINGVQRDTCSVCSQTRLVSIPSNGQHEWYETTRTEPTCTATGTIYYACENCTLTKSESIDALGHDYVLQTSVEPTCTTAGYNTYKCSVCSATKQEVVNATGHTASEENYTIITEPICTESGSATAVCETCGEEYDITLDALGHSYEDVKVEIEDKPGHTLTTPTCTVCGATESSTTVHDEWIDGYYTTTVITSPTCTVTGISVDTCTICSTTRTNTVAATGSHSYYYAGIDEDNNFCYICENCDTMTTFTPTRLKALWNSTYINTAPEDTTLGYLFDIYEDGILNAKDYSLIVKANS